MGNTGKAGRLIVFVVALGACAQTKSAPASPPAPSSVSAEAWARITQGLDSFLDRIEPLDEYAPGAAVIVVTGDGRRYVRVHGETKAGSGYAVTADSAFYIASMTKAYVGLLAARLDVEGVLPLATTLAEVWPGLKLPEGGRQANAVRLRDLLVHSIPFRVPEITFLEAYVRDVAPVEYPGLIERYAVKRQDGFQYDNLGYNIYAAALEARTGKNWRVWLKEKVFLPLRMTATSGRTSEYETNKIAWSHQRAGNPRDGWPRAGGWYLIPPKADGMMQSAGGLMTTANDMAVWLEAQIKGEGPNGSGLTPAIFARARTDRAAQQPSAGSGFSCDGYVYGWGACRLILRAKEDAAGEDRTLGPFFQHGGGYVGVRSLMTAAPSLGFGVAFLSNSDSMTGFLAQEVTKLVFELDLGIPGGDVRTQWRVDEYRKRNARYLADLQGGLQDRRADPKWKRWAWAPDAAALATFAGRYERPGALLPDAAVEFAGDALVLTSSDRRYRLTPAAPDLFGAQTFAYDEIAAVAFVRGPDGKVVALDWNGERYARRAM
ncbi:MAG TPA: serine hydrolase domain-containing protein [Vicinamibacterales bacterium]